MSKSNYQKPTKLTFYGSYLQYAYATGQIEDVSFSSTANPNMSNEDLYNMTIVDPSNITRFTTTSNSYFAWKIPDNWNLDFGMILGHNFKNDLIYQPYSFIGEDLIKNNLLQGSSIVNYNGFGSPQFNGWSAFNLDNIPNDENWIGIDEAHELSGDMPNTNTYIGSVLFGKKWEAPINVDINSSIHYDYGNKIKKTIGGKTLSQMNYYKPNKWGDLDAWELQEDELVSVDSRNGIRRWNITMSFLQDQDVMSQNMMSNSNAWQRDDDSDYYVGADGTSLYNSSNGRDFYTNVLKITMGSHLPIVVNISESKNPDQWAVVRITKYSIKSTNPKFVNVSLTLEEQV